MYENQVLFVINVHQVFSNVKIMSKYDTAINDVHLLDASQARIYSLFFFWKNKRSRLIVFLFLDDAFCHYLAIVVLEKQKLLDTIICIFLE